MRADMYEVLIERPRKGGGFRYLRTNKPQVRDWDGDDGFEDRVAPRQRRTKFFDDHLQPLRRWLRKQVNRPWDKVYSELCATIDTRTTTGQHLLHHLRREVEHDCEQREDGRVYRKAGCGSRGEQAVDGLFVHPRTGLLRHVEPRWKAAYLARREAAARPPDGLVVLGGGRFLWRREGVWYDVHARHCAAKCPETVDFKLATPPYFRYEQAWHVTEKRQLSSRELRQYQLENTAPE